MSLSETQTRLLLLGLTEEQVSVKPTVEAFPSKYNIRSLPLWVEVFNNTTFQARRAGLMVPQAWDYAIDLFSRYCRVKGIPIFPGSLSTNPVDKLASDLAHIRNILARFCERSKMFKALELRPSSLETRAIVTPQVATIFTQARVNKVLTPNIMRYIRQLPYPRLVLGANRVFYRDITSRGIKLRIYLQYLNNLRIFLGYKIDVPWDVGGNVPHAQRNASIPEAEKWLSQELWPSLVTVRRIRGTRFEMF